MKFLVLLCAVLHLSLGQITTEDCMMALSNKFDGSLVSGKALKCCELSTCCFIRCCLASVFAHGHAMLHASKRRYARDDAVSSASEQCRQFHFGK